VWLQAAHCLLLFQFAISHGPGILVQFILVNIVTVVCSFSFFFFCSPFWFNKMFAHILNDGNCNTGKVNRMLCVNSGTKIGFVYSIW
jgi:hypothetical protein